MESVFPTIVALKIAPNLRNQGIKDEFKLFWVARSCLLEVVECVNVPSTRKYKVSSRLVLGASTRKEKRV